LDYLNNRLLSSRRVRALTRFSYEVRYVKFILDNIADEMC